MSLCFFVTYISGTRFEEHCSSTSRDILDSMFNCFMMSTKKRNISKTIEAIPKRKCHSSVFWKAFQRGINNFFYVIGRLRSMNPLYPYIQNYYLLLFFDLLLSFLFLFVTHWYAVFNLCSYSQCCSNCSITVRRWWRQRRCRFWRVCIPPAFSLSLLGSTTCASLPVITCSVIFYPVTPQTLNKVLVIFMILTVNIKQEAVEWKNKRLVLGL